MAVQIVDTVPGARWLRRVGRGLVVVLGTLLFILAVLDATGVIVTVALAVTAWVTQGHFPSATVQNVLIFAAFAAGAVLSVWLALLMIRGRRRMGLYLRKFGLGEPTQTVSHALRKAVGRSLRLVTLDDSLVAPLGAGRGRRRFAAVITVLCLLGVGWVLYYFFGGPLGHLLDPSAHPDQGSRDALGSAILAAFLIILLGTGAVLALVIGVLGGTVYVAARRAERGAARTVTDEESVDATATALARSSRRILAARLAVVAVPSALWQQTVHALAAASEVVVIDVSWPTENLLWEVRNIKPLFRGRWVLVGSSEMVAPLAWPQTFAGHDHTGMLARMLDGELILAYGPGRAGRRRFARALRRRLEQVRRRR